MRGTDGAVRRVARALLAPGETLLASAVGIEHDGRRRQAVLVTSERFVVAPLRGGFGLDLDLDTTDATYDESSATLRAHDAVAAVTVDRIDPPAGVALVALVAQHRCRASAPSTAGPRHVRLVPAPADTALADATAVDASA